MTVVLPCVIYDEQVLHSPNNVLLNYQLQNKSELALRQKNAFYVKTCLVCTSSK